MAIVQEELMQFEAKFADIEPLNPLFSSCKIYVLYVGENRNGSVITKEVVENAIPTLYNIPIVGRYSEDVEDFVDHGGKIEISGSGSQKEIKYVHTTKPYGLVPESANITWETLEDGKEYLVIEGALLWTGRYPEAQTVIDDSKPQSMEVDVVSGTFTKQKKFVVDEMIFSALCILGDDVEPCFENAQITAFSLDKGKFEKEFSAMMQQLKFSISEGGKEEVKVKDLSKLNFSLTSEQLESELRLVLASQKTTDSWGWEYSRYGLIDYLPDEKIAIAIDWDNYYMVGFDFTVTGDVVGINFDTVKRYKVNYVPMELAVVQDGDENINNGEDGDIDDFTLAIKERFNLMRDHFSKKNDDENKNGTEDGLLDNVNGEFTQGSTNETQVTPEVPAQTTPQVSEEFAELSKQFTALKEAFETSKSELDELRQFKADADSKIRQEAEAKLFERFSAHLTEDELKDIREKASDFTLDNLETQLFVLVGKKSSTFSLNSNTKHTDSTRNAMPVFHDNENKEPDKYGGLIDRYGN